jgi:hypothetical protein
MLALGPILSGLGKFVARRLACRSLWREARLNSPRPGRRTPRDIGVAELSDGLLLKLDLDRKR